MKARTSSFVGQASHGPYQRWEAHKRKAHEMAQKAMDKDTQGSGKHNQSGNPSKKPRTSDPDEKPQAKPSQDALDKSRRIAEILQEVQQLKTLQGIKKGIPMLQEANQLVEELAAMEGVKDSGGMLQFQQTMVQQILETMLMISESQEAAAIAEKSGQYGIDAHRQKKGTLHNAFPDDPNTRARFYRWLMHMQSSAEHASGSISPNGFLKALAAGKVPNSVYVRAFNTLNHGTYDRPFPAHDYLAYMYAIWRKGAEATKGKSASPDTFYEDNIASETMNVGQFFSDKPKREAFSEWRQQGGARQHTKHPVDQQLDDMRKTSIILLVSFLVVAGGVLAYQSGTT